MSVNWFPGHMVKARREIEANLKLVDVVIILVDARAPFSCRNPMLEAIIGNKPRLLVLNKIDLADGDITNRQIPALKNLGFSVVTMNSLTGTNKKRVLQEIETLFQPKAQALLAKGRKLRPVRIMVVGVPNTGKSTFLNIMVGKKTAATGAKPGITKGKQWVRIREDIELLDTPGLMWPKVETDDQGMKLALLDIVGENAYEPYQASLYLLAFLKVHYPQALRERFRIENTDDVEENLLAHISKLRGHLQPKGGLDIEKTAIVLLQEFRQGKLGKISLDLL
jgi:ribosome biogenesis GTPase A